MRRSQQCFSCQSLSMSATKRTNTHVRTSPSCVLAASMEPWHGSTSHFHMHSRRSQTIHSTSDPAARMEGRFTWFLAANPHPCASTTALPLGNNCCSRDSSTQQSLQQQSNIPAHQTPQHTHNTHAQLPAVLLLPAWSRRSHRACTPA